MSQSYTINPNQTRVIDAPVHSLSVSVGQAVVTIPAATKLPDDESQTSEPAPELQSYTLQPDSDPLEVGGQGNIAVHSPEGASVSVIFEDEVGAPGGLSGGRNRVPGEQDTVSPEATAGHEKGAALNEEAPEPASDPDASEAPTADDTAEGRQEAKDNADTGDDDGEPASRGDSDENGDPEGGTGPFESRTVAELKATAKAKGITGVSKLNKDDLIARLRSE